MRALRCVVIAVAAAVPVVSCDDPVGPFRPASFTAVSAGGEHTCGIVEGGAAYCWGAGSLGQLGNGRLEAAAAPQAVQLAAPLERVAAGYGHTCGITQGQDLVCWGWNLRGQLGRGNTEGGGPDTVIGDLRFQQVSSGWFHSCALTVASDAYCWGGNGQGQLGEGTTTDRLVPTRVFGDLKFKSIAAGGFHSCGVAINGDLYCWGLNNEGQLGTGSVTNADRPTRVNTDLAFDRVSAGYSHSCALDSSMRPFCWGSNAEGELGVAFISPPGVPGSTTPVPVFDLGGGLVDLDAGLGFTCAVDGGGGGWCWGNGEDGQLGTGAYRSWVVRQPVADVPDFETISAGYGTHSCGLSRVGTILCWGRGDLGQLGSRVRASALPIRVPGVS